MAPAVPDVMPDNVPLPFVPPPEVTGMEGAGGFAGTMGGMGRVNIPNIDVEQIRKNIEAMQMGDPPISTPPTAPPMQPYVPPAAVRPMVDETPTRGGSLAASDMGGRRGMKPRPVKPIGTERVPVAPAVTPAIVPPPPGTPMVDLNMMLPNVPAPVMNMPAPNLNLGLGKMPMGRIGMR
jgi:hypothetical protein